MLVVYTEYTHCGFNSLQIREEGHVVKLIEFIEKIIEPHSNHLQIASTNSAAILVKLTHFQHEEKARTP